jgi:hypothetical protein
MMIETPTPPPRYDPLTRDIAWDPGRHLALEAPEGITLLDEWGPDAAGPTALSPVAITTPFRLLSDEGVAALQEVCGELEQFAGVRRGGTRAARVRRGPAAGACGDP